ncbi:hypothetical protein PWT90_05416 [Aphanocladium album]|nr:hypothetical protein PWT90_05416 [Aphanocladium album]
MPAFAHAYYASFTDDRPGASDDNLMDVLFGDYRKFANETKRLLAAMLTPRLWDLQYRMSALVEDETGDVVGFVCFKRPKCEISFYERWISPTTWLNTLYSVLYSVKSSIAWFLAPPDPASLDPERAASFGRAFVDLEPRIRCSARRRAAWYLSIVAVDPSYQDVEVGGPAVWLSARRGTEGLYRKFGFVKVMESNEGPLAEWNGGAIMFRGLEGVEDMS